MAKEVKDPPSTHEDLSAIWGRAAKKSTMFKDLPRLAKRITVIVEGWGECVTFGNLTNGIPLNQCLTPGGPVKQGTWTCPVCQQTNPPEVWKRCKMCGTLKVQERRVAIEEKDQTEATVLSKHYPGLVVDAQWTDLHYYEARILKIAGSVATVSFPQFPESGNFDVSTEQIRPRVATASSSSSEALSAWDACVNVLSVCVAAIDTQEVVERLNAGVIALTESARPETLATTMQDLMLEHLHADTRTYRIFQSIHQNILVPALVAVQTRVYAVLQKEGFLTGSGGVGLMQDVRSDDGWTVEITIGTDTVTVKHFRMEQNCPDIFPTHFTVKWCLTMTFDKNVSKLCGSGVRIDGLKCHPKMAADSKRRIQDIVQVGLVVV